jgi:hypothetical protein
LETKLDHSDYDEAALIELRIPLNAPYLSGNSTDFERFDGEIEIDGIHYKYLKRKVVNDELVLLCLPNESKNRIHNSRVEFFKLVNDLNHPASQGKEKNSSSTSKNFISFFTNENNCYSLPALSELKSLNAEKEDSFPKMLYSSILKPPPKKTMNIRVSYNSLNA